MSVELYDLGQRLRAGLAGRPVARSSHALALPPVRPIAVAVDITGPTPTVTATDALASCTGRGPGALAALAQVYGPLSDDHRSLVVPDRATLRALVELARASAVGGPDEAIAEVLDWWQTRSEHPGSGAVLVLTEACRARWTLGVAPAEERRFTVWRTWLGLAATDPRAPGTSGMLPGAGLVTAGVTLPGLDTAAQQDTEAWMALRSRAGTPASWRTWRSRDSRARAALGLATRSDAVDLLTSYALDDPRIAAREAFTGNVVHAVLTAVPEPGVIEAHADRLICRLRPGADLTVTWDPQPALPGAPTASGAAGSTTQTVSAVLTASSITGDGRLLLVLTGAPRTVARLSPGDLLTVRAARITAAGQVNSRRTLSARYRHRRNWLAAGVAPAVTRRSVPLDVIVAAAEN